MYEYLKIHLKKFIKYTLATVRSMQLLEKKSKRWTKQLVETMIPKKGEGIALRGGKKGIKKTNLSKDY